jgi:protein-tyrosine phosphatase
MRAELYFVDGAWPGRLAIAPRPRGGDWLEDETRSWRQSNIGVVLSLLTKAENIDLELANEAELCQSIGIHFLSFPIADRAIPESRDSVAKLTAEIAGYLVQGKNCLVHCRQGIGRAGLVSACVMIRLGMNAESAVRHLSAARGCPVPETPEQRQWITEFARFHAVSKSVR